MTACTVPRSIVVYSAGVLVELSCLSWMWGWQRRRSLELVELVELPGADRAKEQRGF